MTASPVTLHPSATDEPPRTPSSERMVQRLPLSRARSWQPALPEAPSLYAQGCLALTYSSTAAEQHHRPPRLSLVPAECAPEPSTRVDLTERWAATLMQAVMEVIASDRPLAQLVRWTSRSVYAEVSRRRQLVERHRSSDRLRSSRQHVATVHVCQPTEDAAEVAARVTFGGRSRAVAARLDRLGDRWVCTAIRFG